MVAINELILNFHDNFIRKNKILFFSISIGDKWKVA